MADEREVRIRARKMNNGKVEFTLQVYTPETDYSYQWLPSSRMFPYHTASVDQWLYSSDYSFGKIGRWLADYYSNTGEPFIFNTSNSYGYLRPRPGQKDPYMYITCDWDWNVLRVIIGWDTDIAANSQNEIGIAYRFDEKDQQPKILTNLQTGDTRFVYPEESAGEDERILTLVKWLSTDPPGAVFAIPSRSFVDSAREADYVLIAASDSDNQPALYAIFEFDELDAALETLPCY